MPGPLYLTRAGVQTIAGGATLRTQWAYLYAGISFPLLCRAPYDQAKWCIR